MNLALKISRRYLFAKKSTNAINIISGISVFGLSLGAAALILVLSVFNGFEKLITNMIGNFNPDVKITAAKGKTFVADSLLIDRLRRLKGVALVSQTLEEVAFLQYDKNQASGVVKGVDSVFAKINHIDSTIREGTYLLKDKELNYVVLGGGLRNQLGTNVDNPLTPLTIYMPKRSEVGALDQPFVQRQAIPSGTFVIQQDFDNQYVIADLELVRDLLDAPNELGALEVKLDKSQPAVSTLQAIRNLVGPSFVVKNRFQQDEAFLKIMNLEKWMSYAILSLTLLLVAFNLVGSLWMIVLEKKKDVAILNAMGAEPTLARNIFLYEGLLLCAAGLFFGCIAAVALYEIHISTPRGLIALPPGFAVDRYPAQLKVMDFLVVAVTVLAIGLLASLPPALRAMRISGMIREE